jgi:nucleoside-diphosphate-sugar epimerase
MKALFVGGTGTISSAIVRRLAEDKEWEVWLINRGNRKDTVPDNVHQIICDINDEDAVLREIGNMVFDVIGEFIGFHVEDVERDYRLFKGKTKQYIYISSASAYHKPSAGYVIVTEKREDLGLVCVSVVERA